jgi:HAD superfamily hydrolase (TIGR01549 family)
MASEFSIGFDFDHTLGIDNKLERTVALAMLADHAAAHGIQYDAAAAGVAIDETLAQYRSSDRSIESCIAGFFERFAPDSNVLDITGQFRDAVVAAAPDHVQALPGATEMLAKLDEMGVPYALLTNGWSPLQEEKARLIGFRGPVFVSERIGVRKPSPEAFAFLAKHFELPFDAIWYVGDDPAADCAGARNLGMTSVWFDWENRGYPEDLARADHVIHSLDEIPRLASAGRIVS